MIKIFCKHSFYHYETIHGDMINHLNCRTIWECSKCGKLKRDKKYYGEING